MIEWSGCTRGNGEPDWWELLHNSIVEDAMKTHKSSHQGARKRTIRGELGIPAP